MLLLSTAPHLVIPMLLTEGFPGCSAVKNPPANEEDGGDMLSILESERSPGGENWQPTLVSSPEESHGQRSLAGYSSQGRKVGHN